ncbi:DUF3306 domain-containing protein [Methylophaga sp. OBS1]|uniref:DUF3306 domain-containing protein n=1 Tax=Methylophaga sp. OBS1 TaxID=2991933 RepID=UPI0022599EBF|nr:DUF3306 domain-containing protein [Methylophaga sp. OBS1]MCX4193066.1 DUF3306 domain-containing protein [Methylophaga sp. OBS1]
MSDEHEQGFLSRWSRRKLDQDSAEEEQSLTPATEEPVETVEASDQITDTDSEQEKPIWQRDDVDEETRKSALRALFRKPEFNVRDGLNEYDDDFTKFASLGNVVTHEMKRMLKLAEEKTRPPQMPENSAPKQTDKQSDNQDKEDKDLA